MRRVDVLIVGNGPRAIAVADHAFSLRLSTAIVSAESVTDGNTQLLHEVYECAHLSLDTKSRILRAEGMAYVVELCFSSLIIAPEPAIGLQAKEDSLHNSLEDSFYTSSTYHEYDNQHGTKYFTDDCMEISMIRNAHIIVRPKSILNWCSSSILKYLQESANLKIYTCESNYHTTHDNLPETYQIFAPINPLKLAKVSIISKGKIQPPLSIYKHSRRENRIFFEATASRVYILGASHPVTQQADEIFKMQVFPCRLYQQRRPKGRMTIEYSPGQKIVLYGQQQKALCDNHSMYITIRLQSKGDTDQVSEVYLTQLGVVLGFALFIPEMMDLVAPLILCCNNKLSIVRLLPCWEDNPYDTDTGRTRLTELVLTYYKTISNDEIVSKAIHMSFQHRVIVKIVLFLSPVLLVTTILMCLILIF